MKQRKPDIHGLAIVLRGDFNPRIFHPQWFANFGIIPPGDANAAKIHIIHSDLTFFELEWMSLRVTDDSLQVHTPQEPYFPFLADLVINAFAILEHTPLYQVGINTHWHFAADSTDATQQFMQSFFAPDRLADLGPDVDPRSFTIMTDRNHTTDTERYQKIEIERSVKLDHGYYIGTNFHIGLLSRDPPQAASPIIDYLKESFQDALDKATGVANTINLESSQ